MKLDSVPNRWSLLLLAALVTVAPRMAMGQSPRDALEALRNDFKADRTAVIAEEMKLTSQESEAFWPLYRSYRTEVDATTDSLVKLILEYADHYPDVPEAKARELLNRYLKFEDELLGIKHKYIKKFEKVLPPTKVFRFAQLDNRLDLGVRVRLAASIPVLTADRAPSAGDKR
jgi:hypothetical protein